jgi:hypothetical protein
VKASGEQPTLEQRVERLERRVKEQAEDMTR